MTRTEETKLTFYLLHSFVFSLIFLEVSLIVRQFFLYAISLPFTVALFLVISLYAGKFAGDPRVTTYTLIISALSISSLEIFFPLRLNILSSISLPSLAFFVGFASLIFEDNYPQLWNKTISRRYLKAIVTVSLVFISIVTFVVAFGYYFDEILKFAHIFEEYQGILSFVGLIITFIGGILLERRRHEK